MFLKYIHLYHGLQSPWRNVGPPGVPRPHICTRCCRGGYDESEDLWLPWNCVITRLYINTRESRRDQSNIASNIINDKTMSSDIRG